MFCHIMQNWLAKPVICRIAVVDLIAATTTKTGLTVRCEVLARFGHERGRLSVDGGATPFPRSVSVWVGSGRAGSGRRKLHRGFRSHLLKHSCLG